MLRDIVAASYRGEYRIEVTFDDGACGIIDFSIYLERGGVFQRFRDMDYFRQFKVNPELGTLTWPDGVDVAPETLYAHATATPLPAWMIPEDARV